MCYFMKFIILLSLPYLLEAMCYDGPLTQSEYGEAYCAYEVDDFWYPMEVGETFTDDIDCMNCTCTLESGLQCCGYGIMAGLMRFTPDCQIDMIDNCNYRLVKVDNILEEC